MTAPWWLFFNFCSIAILAFYSMLEMACVSFNKVRLQYYVNQRIKSAIWLHYLLLTPSRLFGTTLIGVNVALVVGSECAREFHSALGLDPNFAPFSQVVLVIIFGELAPMFAARNYPEHVAMLGASLLYFSSKLLAPLIWVLSFISSMTLKLFGDRLSSSNTFLSQEELLKILEEQEDDIYYENEYEDVNVIAANIFQLRGKTIEQIMRPLQEVPMLPSNATVVQMTNLMLKTDEEFIPLYHKQHQNVIGIIHPRDLLRAPETKRVRDFSRSPWFITQNNSLFEILKQFRLNNENIGIVIDKEGNAIGTITLDVVLEEIFGKSPQQSLRTDKENTQLILKNRSFPGSLLVREFNRELNVKLSSDENQTFSDLIANILGHTPEVGDLVVVGSFEITVTEANLLGAKVVQVSSLQR